MASCSATDDEMSEKNRKNSYLLKSHIFKHDVIRVCFYSFQAYSPMTHNETFLMETLQFTHQFMAMLEEYSRGKVFNIKTGKTKMVKKKKTLGATRKHGLEEDLPEEDGDNAGDGNFDPENPDQLNSDAEGNESLANSQIHDPEMDEVSDEEKDVQRQFNFSSEIVLLVDYTVISRLVGILSHKELSKNPEMIAIVANFFKRVVYQLKQSWIFFQLDFLAVFQQFLQDGQSSNPLMKNLNNPKPTTIQERKLEVAKTQLKDIVQVIVTKFV
jgi:hypothetical protein